MAQQFKVLGHETWYEVTEITTKEANDVGCPGSTHRIKGPRTGQTYWGTFVTTVGRTVKIPGTINRKGQRAVFVAAFGEDHEQLPGHLTTD